VLPDLFVGTISRCAMIRDLGSTRMLSLTPDTNVPGANNAFYIPILIPWPYPMKRIWIYNGTAISGNVDLGLYSRQGSKVVSTGSFAHAGASAMQYRSLSYLISPGSYFLAFSCDNGTSNFQRFSLSSGGISAREIGMLTQTSAFPLPAVMTPVNYSGFSYFHMGLTLTESGF
jgi:hypothetical protein